MAGHGGWRVLVLALGLGGVLLWAQAGQGRLSGVVRDSSGASVPGAQVQVTDPATGRVFRAVTSPAGVYALVSLPPATYEVAVRHKGFATAVEPRALVTVDHTTSLDFVLRPGAVTQEVEVTAAPGLAATSSSTVGQLITSATIARVPSLDRDVYELIQLSPGVNATNGTPNAADTTAIFNDRPGAEVSAYTINGSIPGKLAYLLDGSPIGVGENNLGALIPAFQVPQDAVQEFRVETQDVPASYRSGGAGVISLVTKSGTNQFHGNLFTYLRPNALAANDSFAKAAELEAGQPNKPLNFHRYQEGGAVGGPLLRNKLFFFADYEATQQETLQTGAYTVPTVPERLGNFSADSFPIYNPLAADQTGTGCLGPTATAATCPARQPFSNNTIPTRDLNPIALKYAQDFPLPNQPGTGPYHVNNYFASGLDPDNSQKFDIRLDGYHGSQHLFGRFSFARLKFGDADLYGASNIYDPNYYQNITNARNFLLADDWDLSPNTLVQFRYSFTRHYENQTGDPRQEGFDMTSVGFPASLAASSVYADIPVIYFSDATTNLGSNPYTTFKFAAMNHDATVTLTTLKGSHDLSFGFEFEEDLMNEGQPVAPSGWYQFDNTATSSTDFATDGSGTAFASFLLGMGENPGYEYDNFSTDIFTAEASPYFGLFAQDNWQVTPKLTVNFGVRWDIFGGRTERYNRLEYFDPTIQYTVSGVPLTGGEQFVANGQSPFLTNWTNFGPRFGLTYAVSKNLLLRGGAGVYYGPSTEMVSNGELNSDGFVAYSTWNATQVNVAGNTVMLNSLSDPFPSGIAESTRGALGAATNLGLGLSTELHSQPTPATYDYNLGLEYRLPSGWVASAAWVGSRGVYLPSDGIDLNALSLETVAKYGATLDTNVASKLGSVMPAGSAFYHQAEVPLWLTLMPFPQFNNGGYVQEGISGGGVGVFADPLGSSTYQSLQLKLQKQLTRNFTTLAGFTWGKLLTNLQNPPLAFIGNYGTEGYQDTDNLNLAWGLSPQDLSYDFTWQTSYDLPVGAGRAVNLKGWANGVLGGWTANAIVYIGSGTPVNTPFDGNDPYFNQAVNLTCNPAGGAPHTTAEWFSPRCFSQPASQFLPGTAPTYLTGVRTDGGRNLDASLYKTISVGEHKSVEVQIFAYNLTNYAQYGYPSVFWSTAPGGLAGFGQITGDVNTPRQFQFALRYQF
ncbi:MAG: TonB-dependent receptor domain-containing protein [Terriglobales bacterium]